MVARLRRALFVVHLWTGLTLGLLTVVIGLTGSLMVYRPEIDRLVLPHPAQPVARSQWGSVQEMLESVRAQFPSETFGTINLPRTDADPVTFWAAKESDLRVYVHPASGEILGARHEERTFSGFLFSLHTKLLTGDTGHTVVGIAGIGLIVLCLSGLVVWWPRKNQKLRDHLTVKRGSGSKRFNYDLHRALGFYVSGLLAVVTLFGVALVFPEPYGQAVERLTGTKLSPKPKAKAEKGAPLPLDRLVALVEAEMPEGRLSRIVLPAKAGAPLVVRKQLPNEKHPNGVSSVALDPVTGKVLKFERDSDASPAQRAMSLRYPVHIGVWGGQITRVLHALLGLAPLVLAVTGLVMWRNRLRRKSRRVKGRQAQLEPSVGAEATK